MMPIQDKHSSGAYAKKAMTSRAMSSPKKIMPTMTMALGMGSGRSLRFTGDCSLWIRSTCCCCCCCCCGRAMRSGSGDGGGDAYLSCCCAVIVALDMPLSSVLRALMSGAWVAG